MLSEAKRSQHPGIQIDDVAFSAFFEAVNRNVLYVLSAKPYSSGKLQSLFGNVNA